MLVAAVLAAGCGAPQGRNEPPNTMALEREVSAWVSASDLAPIAPTGLAFGAAPAAVLIGHGTLPPGAGRDAVPVATISADGKSAWTVEPDPPVRRTVLVERDGKSWRVLMAHASRGVEADVARHNEEKGSWPPLADVGEGVPEPAQELAQILSHALGGADAFAEVISKRPGTAAVGPAAEDHFTGTHEVSEFVRSLYAREGSRVVRSGGMRGGLAAGGDAGWIVTNVDLVVTRGRRDLVRPCRLSVVFAREEGGWAIVQLHLSHALAGES